MNGKQTISCIGLKNKIILIVLLFSVSLQARELSWRWWPTGIRDSVSHGADTLRWSAGVSAVASSGKYAPFWLQSGTHGDVSASPFSGNLTAGIYKEAVHSERWWDFDFAVQMTGRVQSPIPGAPFKPMQNYGTGYFNLAYAHVRLYLFDITAGIRPMIYETQDTALTMGSMIFSGNSQPLPHVTIGIDQYRPFPGLFGYFEIKGGLTHAWMADNVYMRRSFLHHKFAGVRFGGRLPVNISYEFHHAAQWGGISPVWGDIGSGLDAFINVLMAKSGGNMRNDQQAASNSCLPAKAKDGK